ncbi:TolC family protein [Aliiroseovarius sp.]|uniref:TolC family protein n=1 Tax=Aliiroseovarius sp. TaxID=1872442 RepID=UPI003BA85239
MIGACAALALSGCMSGVPHLSGAEVSRASTTQTGNFAQTGKQPSVIIQGLQDRRTVLEPGSTYDQVAQAVLAGAARPAEAELQAARLRAAAADKNWLPTLGPSVSLSDMGELVASIVIDQVIYDNGRKRAEREFARADVEAAAVTLSIDTNDRIYTGLDLYLRAQEAREKAAVSSAALAEMREFDRIMTARVRGGISDMSDQNVIRAKLAELQSNHDKEVLDARTALAELNAMSDTPLDAIRGISQIHEPPSGNLPLTVLRASAEKDRDVAQATIDRAGLLPGVTARASAGESGSAGLIVGSDAGFGFGTGDSLRAIEAAREAATRRIAQAQEDADRRMAALEQKLAALTARAGASADVAAQARANTDLFQRQFDAGTRTVMDVVGVVENQARLDRDHVALRYEIARTQVEIARERGVLASGADI